jgi:RNA polymerase sigma factor (sigma-70 family)
MDTRTDSDLMAAYADACDENAFAELVARHQQMVYRVCLRMLRHHQEAEDATQAVFLVLLNKASRLMTRKGEFTGWLYGVARNVCLEALRKRARRQEEAMLDETEEPAVEEYRPAHEEVLPFLDEELAGLTGVLRQAVVLRYLQNHSEAEAARRVGCAVGTLSSRASRGIERLRQRLAKRGIALGGVALAGLLTSEASAAVPETLLPSILASVKVAVATTAAGTGAASTAAMLAKGAMKAMYIAKVKMVAIVTAAAIAVGGAGVTAVVAVAKDQAKPAAQTTRTDPAAVVITPRTWNAWEAFEELDLRGGPRVVVLGVQFEVYIARQLEGSWDLPWTVGMRSPYALREFFMPPSALCLLVPPELRFVPVEGRKLIEAVAASRRLKTAWAQDGRVALLYEGVPDAEVDGVRKDLESPDQAIRREAAWRAGWMRDVRVVPLLVKAAKNADAKTARQAVEGLRRLNWGAVVALDGTAVDLIAAELDLKAREDSPKRRAALGGLAYAGGEKVLALLENALTDKDTGVRQAAAKALGYVGGEKAVVLLEKALGDDDPYPAVAAVRALARVGDDKALALVGKAMTDGRFRDRGFCFLFCYAAGPLACTGGEKALALLEKALANQDGNVRYHAAGALGRVGGDKALALIEKALGDRSGHGEVRTSAINALGLVGGDKAMALLEKLFNAGGNDRRDAASALAHMGGDKALALLEKALDDKSALGLECKEAAGSLRNYSGDKALALIEKALDNQKEEMREPAAAALGTVGDEKALALIEKTIADKRNKAMGLGGAAAGAAADSLVGYMDSDKGMDLIQKTLGNSDSGVRRAAAIALFHAVGDRQALPLIEKAYAGGEVLNDAGMRQAAILALGRIGPHKAPALMAKALEDSNEDVRRAADEALKCVGGEKTLAYFLTSTNSATARRFAVEELGNLGGGKARDLLLGRLAVEKDKNVLASIESRLRMDFPDDPAVEQVLKDSKLLAPPKAETSKP